MDLLVFTQNGDASSLDFLNDPFLPINIVDQSAQYANIQLLTILSTDAPNACPLFNAIHTAQLFNQETTAQSQAQNQLVFSVPANQSDAQYVTEGNLVAFKDLDGNYQMFEIRRVDEYHTNPPSKTATCTHAAPTELIDEWVDNVSLVNVTPAQALAAVLDGTRWMVGNVTMTTPDSVYIMRTNTLAGLTALIAQFGGEMQFRVEVSGAAITGMYVDWLVTVGSNTGKRFEFGKDITSVQRTSSIDPANLKTALYGYGQQDKAGNPLTFANVTWSTANGDPVDKPPGQTWVGDPAALANNGRNKGTRHRFGSFTDSQATDPATLLQETWNALQAITTPLVSYQMNVVDLESISGYSWEKVRMGDTAAAIDTTFQPVLRLTARVLQIARDLINPTNTQVTLGNFLPTTAGKQPQLKTIQQTGTNTFDGSVPNVLQPGAPIPTQQLQGAIDALRNQIQSSKAYVYFGSEGILVYDKPEDQNPTKAFLLGAGIFGIANAKNADGSWAWNTFGTGDGFTADLMNTGTLDADKVNVTNLSASNIKTGTLSGIEVDLSDSTGANTAKLTGGKSQTYTADYAGSGWNITQTTDGSGMNFSAKNGTTTEQAGINYIAGTGAVMQAGNNSITGIQTYNDRVWTKNQILDDGATGNMSIGGNFTAVGTKSAVVKTKRFGWRKLYAIESPENWFEDFEESKTDETGHAAVLLEEIFLETVDTSKGRYKVFLQGIDSSDLKVTRRTPRLFCVEGPPNTRFMYRIIAYRKGYANVRLEKHDPARKASAWRRFLERIRLHRKKEEIEVI